MELSILWSNEYNDRSFLDHWIIQIFFYGRDIAKEYQYRGCWCIWILGLQGPSLVEWQAITNDKPTMTSSRMHTHASGLNALQWRHNEHHGVSNHRRLECLLNLLSGADQRKYESSASLAFMGEIHRRPVNSPHKGPVTWKMFPFDGVIMVSILKMYQSVFQWTCLNLMLTCSAA